MPSSDLPGALSPALAPGSAAGTPAHARRPAADRVFDARFARRFAAITGLVPVLMLAWDAQHGQLGVNGVNYAIRTTGLLGLVFLTLTLAVTPLRKLVDWPSLIAARRALGLLGFFYIALHFLIFFYWDRDASVTSTAEEVVERRYLQFGFAALVLMIPLAITSTDAMVRRLGARRWKLLHRLAYLIVIGGVVHYYLLVKADVRKPRAFAIVVGALLLYRLVAHYVALRRNQARPGRATATARTATPATARTATAATARTAAAATARTAAPATARTAAAAAPAPAKRPRFWTGELRVARVFDETHDVRTFRLVPPGGGPLPFEHQPGQYLNLALTIDGRRVNRSYTIASSPTRAAYVELTVKRKAGGYGSHHVHDAFTEGARVKVGAPAGRFVFTGAGADRVLLLAGGVGITPLMAMVRYLTDHAWPGQIHLICAVRTPRDVIFADELAYLSRRFPNLHVVLAATATDPGDDWRGERGHVTADLLTRAVPDLARVPVYLCGPEPMMVAMRAVLTHLGVPDTAIHTEAFVSPPTPAASDDPDALILAEPTTLLDDPAAALDDPAAGAPIATALSDHDQLFSIRFQRSGKTYALSGDRTVLEAAEDAGIDLPYECRSGICGQCKTRLLTGRVTMDSQDALSAAERKQGLILACQARATHDLTIDA